MTTNQPPARFSDWMRVGKFQPPCQKVTLVNRNALLTRLDAGLTQPLSVIISPPGFGKTTLLSQWWNVLRSRADPITAWLSLNEDDGESMRFLAGVVSSLARSGMDVGRLEAAAAEDFSNTSLKSCLATLAEMISTSPKQVVLLLDDFHRIGAGAGNGVIEDLLRCEIPNLHVSISARNLLQIRVTDMYARGLVHSLDAHDLVLSIDESAELFNGMVTPDEHRLLYERTEGWPVASQLAKLWLEADPGRRHRLCSLSWHDTRATTYLSERVFEDLSRDVQGFLVETSVLDRFNAPLADATRSRGDSSSLLKRHEHFDALLIPLDAEREWFRLHPLFRDYLQHRLLVCGHEHVAKLHRSAAAWLDAHGDLIEAVRQLHKAGDHEQAIALITKAGGWKLLITHGIGFTHNLLLTFARERVRANPTLSIMQAYLHIKRGELAEARHLLDGIRHALPDLPVELFRDYVVIDSLWEGYTDDFDGLEYLPALREQMATLSPSDDLADATLLAVYACAALAVGEFSEAETASREAIRKMRKADSIVGMAYGFFHLGQSLYFQGRWREAEALYGEAMHVAEENLGKDSMLKAVAESLLARMHYERNRINEAARLIDSALARIDEQDGWLDIYASAYEIAIRVAVVQSDPQAALRQLQRAEACARTRQLQRLEVLTQAWRQDLFPDEAITAPVEAVVPFATSSTNPVPQPFHWRGYQAFTVAAIRRALAHGGNTTAFNLAVAARAYCTQQGRRADVALFDVLAALACKARGDNRQALDRLNQAVELTADQDAIRLFLDASPGIESLLQWALRQDGEFAVKGAKRNFVLRLLHHMKMCNAGTANALSSREVEILRELCRGRSNKAIGRVLDLSENTIKFHLKHIYQKLKVRSRSEALAAAGPMGFFPLEPVDYSQDSKIASMA